jgi:hypothetical protein
MIPIYRDATKGVFINSQPGGKPRDCKCLKGDCVREWDYTFGVQNPGE